MWPLWVKIYTVVVATPMVIASGAIALWIFLTGFGGTFENPSSPSAILMMSVFSFAFLFTMGLFMYAIKRVIADQNEAIVLAATGHLMLAIPAMVFVMVAFLDNTNRFVSNLENGFQDIRFNFSMQLVLWMAFHTYLGLILALYDNTSETV